MDANHGAPHVAVWAMSLCPDAHAFVLSQLKPAVAALGPAGLRVKMEFFGAVDRHVPSGFAAPHGQGEVYLNEVELCVQRLFPKHLQWLDFVVCMSEPFEVSVHLSSLLVTSVESLPVHHGQGQLHERIRECGTNFALSKLLHCANGTEGALLFAESIEEGRQRDPRASPTVDIDGSMWCGQNANVAISCQHGNFTHELCSRWPSPRPRACGSG